MYRIENHPKDSIDVILNEIFNYMEQHPLNRKSAKLLSVRKELRRTLKKYEEEYKENGEDLQQITNDNYKLSTIHGISNTHMKELYKDFFDSDSRFRQNLYNLTPNRCPICDANWGYAVRTLDHILPESIFPQFSILPLNLVPTCYRCNHSKSTTVGYLPNEGVINPFFNNINLTNYLKCYIYIQNNDFTTHIHLKPESDLHINHNRYQRLKFFYEKVYKMDETYSEVTRTSILNSLLVSLSKVGPMSQSQTKRFFSSLLEGMRREEIIKDGIVTTEYLKLLLLDSLIEVYDSNCHSLIQEMISEKLVIKRQAENF